ncbi:hypothetical protein [Roseitranquillus sediminis]|uniref:hypothetical protein n=1 Tax=Roseitranquillus sediminis TaxID=2809051 RepID=UPI001D0C1828|nr:hypothetical protein [Roseitranquillus sediminis]MBM9595935.1 hypothetical protein [Roseitranquillus sediminis]
MKTTLPDPPSLDDLASTAVRLGRELERTAHAVCAGGNTGDFGIVARTLRRIGEREAFEVRDDASLQALRGILEADLRSEIVGQERRFIETHYDADGQHGEIRDCPIYSERGQELLLVRDTLSRFMAARDATLERIAAERAVLRLLRA